MAINLFSLKNSRGKSLPHKEYLSYGKRILTRDLGPCLLPEFLIRNSMLTLVYSFHPLPSFLEIELRNWPTEFLVSFPNRDCGDGLVHGSKSVFYGQMSPGILFTQQQAFFMEGKLEQRL